MIRALLLWEKVATEKKKNRKKKRKKKRGEKKEKMDENNGHYVIASSRPPERRPLERRTLVPIIDDILESYVAQYYCGNVHGKLGSPKGLLVA